MKPIFFLASLTLALSATAAVQAQAPAAAPQAAASANAELETAGKNAAQGWLLLLDRQDWGTAWDASSAVFRQTVPLGSWMDAIPKVRQPYGALVERQAVEAIYKTSLPGRPDGQYVTVLFASQYKNENVHEIVTTVRESDGRWRVTGYNPKPVK
ncbi:DUF4019 domain-containing protein [Ramlibacter sp. XY19]|uniref:DUF4019 domain-containing protein n=1 Tax=Ramlibacter paludis TaxID=2908000 RepID=UPI0023DC373C|nr:DUF4019 domain-containing protein [Ramlibacter paludis]MCG2593152.1 DUF4019 domain-containing protein [Ramlibacter paludis]